VLVNNFREILSTNDAMLSYLLFAAPDMARYLSLKKLILTN